MRLNPKPKLVLSFNNRQKNIKLRKALLVLTFNFSIAQEVKFMLNLNKLAKGAYLRQTKYFTKIKLNILVLIKESNYL